MDKREQAKRLLAEMQSCQVKAFRYIDETQQGMMWILWYLKYAEREVIAGDLARELGVSPPRIANLLKKMEKHGFITRHPSAEDARRSVVEITPEGCRCITESEEQSFSFMEFLLDKIGQDDLNELIRILRKIKTALGE